RGVLYAGHDRNPPWDFGSCPKYVLLDISGRKALDLVPGENDVRALAPGVYFISEELGVRGEGLGKMRKVVVTR
ncbi:hypothetical protein JXD38_06785, partial [candidate division WOR-3 bacterium]|nr:hypothetical protein [candidate division WOR-3 bacterium]